uniref:ORF2a n=1 Tax=Rice yellow mottle virus TaxID=31744 RepID=A0A3G2KJW8_9VIRU|nr:ORF2a [Rice yellow mottle virus]
MGSSVVGRFLTRTKETTRVDSNLLIVLAGLIAAAIVSERLPVTASFWAIPSAIIANWIVLSAHESFSRFVEGVEIEPMSTLRYGKVQSAPRFDPSRGYVVDVSYNGHVIPVILDFATTTALSVPQRVNPGVSMEASRGGLPPTSVKLEDVPPSVVVLYHDSVRLGLGTRVRTPTGRDLLMTNHHIAALEPNGIAYKGHLKKVALDAPVIACDHPHIDCAFYEVPPKIWSLLGVKSASLKPLVKQTAVSLFGGSSSTDFSSCVGIAQIGDNPFLIRHQSTTCSGWSGSPLYHKGCVVGLHIGAADGYNVASNVAWYFHTFKRDVVVESPFEIYGKFREANSEEYDESLRHGVEYAEYDFSGDTIRASSNTWVRERERYHAEERRKSGQLSWADRFGDDSGEDVDIETSHPVAPSISKTRRKRSKRVEQFVDAVSECSFSFESAHEGIVPETSAYDHVPLNCQGAGSSLRASPPLDGLSNSENTTGTPSVIPSLPTECLSATLENRVSSLENTLGKVSAQLSKTQSQYSQILKDLAGLRGEVKQSLTPSSSKPADSPGRYVPPGSRKQSNHSKKGTQKSPPGDASGTSGGSTTSSTKSKESSAKPAK